MRCLVYCVWLMKWFAPFKNNNDMITDLLLFGMCNAQEGMNPFNKMGALQVSLEQSLSPSYNLGLLEPTDDFGFGMVYQSSAKMRMKGKYLIDNAKAPQELIKGLNSSATGQILARILGLPGYVPDIESGLVAMDLSILHIFRQVLSTRSCQTYKRILMLDGQIIRHGINLNLNLIVKSHYLK